ncbi:peroxiredoxin family protein [Polaribacter sp.]|uniref:peroxiredoxin family protein n=1 Tax=Polaribacter sp. TaxID=1920175 RepID=UPI003EF54011
MKKKYLQFFALIAFCFFISPINSQWKYPNADKIVEDVVITYKVEYDEPLTEEQKKSIRFQKGIIVYFNNDMLVEKTFTGKTGYTKMLIIDYNKGVYYSGNSYKTYKNLIVKDLITGNKDTKLESGIKENLLDISCDVYTKSTSTKKILTTKKFGIRYSKNYKCEGLLLKYMGRDISLGSYTVTATRIESLKLPKKLFSLNTYVIKTSEEQKRYNAEKKKEYDERKAQRKQLESEKIDTKAPNFYVRSIKNKKFKSKDLKDKIIVLNFWYTGCPPCKKEIPQLNKLKDEFKDKDVEFIAFALDQEYKIAEFLKSNPFNYDIVEDASWEADEFEIKAYPTNIIIDKDGKISYFKSSYRSDIYESMSYKIHKLLTP